MFSVLKAAFTRAERLQLSPYNPVAGFRFGDFNQSQILPKVGRLYVEDSSQLLQQLAHAPELAGQLALMSFLHGNRTGELRQARWADINISAQVWRIPVAYKVGLVSCVTAPSEIKVPRGIQTIDNKLNTLTNAQRAAIVGRYIKGLNNKELANWAGFGNAAQAKWLVCGGAGAWVSALLGVLINPFIFSPKPFYFAVFYLIDFIEFYLGRKN